MINATLVLEGGGTRGVFTAGILDYLMEQDIYLSHVIGVSAGACNAMDYLSKQIGRTRDCFIPNEKNPHPMMNSPKEALKQKELMNMELAFNLLPYELIPFDFDTYFNSEMKNESVVTNLETGEAQYLDEREDGDRLLDIVRASCSIPFASKIAYVDDIPYLDGGVADSIPIKRALELPNEKIVVIRTRGKDYRKSPVSRGMVALYKKVYKNYPKAVKTMAFRNKVYNEQVEFLDEIEKEGKAFVINPMIKEPSRMEKDADKLINFYEHGYDTMRYKLDEMMKYIEG